MNLKFLAGIFAVSYVTTTCAVTELKTAAQDNQPKFIQQGTTITGIAIDMMRAIEKIDPELKFVGDQSFVPQKRIELGLSDDAKRSNDHLDVFFGFTKDAEREKKITYSKLPMYGYKNILAVRADDTVQVSTLEDIKKLSGDNVVLANSGYAQAKLLRAIEGLKVDDGASTNDDNLNKLVLNRARFFFCSDVALLYTLKTFESKAKVKILPVSFNESANYIVFSHTVPKEITDKVDVAFKKLLDSGEIAKIMKKYAN